MNMHCIDQGVLDGGGFFPSRVTAHFVEREGDARPRTTILIKVSEEVVNRCALLHSERWQDVTHDDVKLMLHCATSHVQHSSMMSHLRISTIVLTPNGICNTRHVRMSFIIFVYISVCVHSLSLTHAIPEKRDLTAAEGDSSSINTKYPYIELLTN